MARASKSHKTNEENMRTPEGLELPYSPRVDGHRYVIYCSLTKDDDPYPRQLILKFLATYAARFFIKKLIRDDELEWAKFMDRDWMLTTSSGISIRASKEQLREIMDYEPSEKEKEWTDAQLIGSINRFRYGVHEEAPAKEPLPEFSEGGQGDGEESSTKDAKPARTAKPKREKVDKGPKPDLSAYTSANDIANELGVLGREVRGVLRSLKLQKPDHGWSWPKKEATEIKDRIKAELKKAKKK